MHKNPYKNSSLWCTYREAQNCSSKKGMVFENVFDLPTRAAAEAADAEKKTKNPPAGEVPFDKSQKWERSVEKLLDDALGEEAPLYKDFYYFVYSYMEQQQESFAHKLPKTESFQLKDYVITLSGPGVTHDIDISAVYKEMRSEVFRRECDIERRRARNRLRSLDRESTSDGIARIEALERAKSVAEKRKALESRAKPPADPWETMSKYERSKATTRKEFVDQALKANDDGFPNAAYFESWITTGTAQSFSWKLRSCDYGSQMEELFDETPKAKEGYMVNPLLKFVRQGEGNWKERLHALIKRHAQNDTIKFKDVAQELYNERYEEVKQDLKEKFHVSDKVLKLMDRDTTAWDVVTFGQASRDQDLQKTYRRFANLEAKLTLAENANKINKTPIPDELKEWIDVHSEIKSTAQYLGDYVAYTNRLVTLIDKLTLRQAESTPYAPEDDIFGVNHGTDDEKKTKNALWTFFKDAGDPQEFTHGLWGRNATTRRAGIEFQDLHGNTATLKGEWFSEDMSKETAYKLAYEEAEVITVDGERQETKLSPKKAKEHLNTLLELGIAANSVLPGTQTIQDIMGSIGLTPYLSGDRAKDVAILFESLKINELSEVSDPSLLAARTKFIQIGRVIYTKQKEENNEKIEDKKNSAAVKLNEDDAEKIIQTLAKQGQFNKDELVKIKKELMGGGLVLLPEEGGKLGAALGVTIPLGKGFSLQATLGMPRGLSGVAGVGISHTTEVSKGLTIVVSGGVGGGYIDGWTTGGVAGVGLNKELGTLGRYDVSFNASAGILRGGQGWGLGLSAGISFSEDTQKLYEAQLAQAEKTENINELLNLDPREVYKAVSEHRPSYPKLGDMLYQIQDIKGLSETSKRNVFINCFQMLRERLQKEAVTNTAWREGWWKLVPTGFGLGLATVGFAVKPYGYLEFKIGGETVVYRTAQDEREVAKVADAEVTAAILKKMGRTEVTFSTTRLELNTGKLIFDEASGKFKQSRTSLEVDMTAAFSKPDNFALFREEIAKNARIFVDQGEGVAANLGLVRLRPQGAHGNINLYIDPALEDNVIVVHKGGELYLSVKSGSPLFLKREDITYPFEHRGAQEDTIITISGTPAAKKEDLEMEASHFLDRAQGMEWIARPAGTGMETTKKEQQTNIMEFDKYKEWWAKNDKEHEARLKPLDTSAIKERTRIHGALINVVLSTDVRPMRTDLDATIIAPLVKALKEDPAFGAFYRLNSTERIEIKTKVAAPAGSTWALNYPELVKSIQERVATFIPKPAALNGLEIDAVLSALIIASFTDITRVTEKKKERTRTPKEQSDALLAELIGTTEKPGFQTRMLKAVFEGYYQDTVKDSAERAKKVDAAVELTIKKLKIDDIDPARKGRTMIDPGTLFASIVGTQAEMDVGGEKKMVAITGIRSVMDFGDDKTYGILNKQALSLSANDSEGDLAKFWFEKLSPHTKGLDKVTIPDAQKDKTGFAEFQLKMYNELYNPLVTKLMPFLALTMTNEEMAKLTALYEKENRFTNDSINPLITADNVETVKKVFKLCDLVRDAQIGGKKQVALDSEFTIIIDKLEVATGLYEKCTNISGFVQEEFLVTRKHGAQARIGAGMSEHIIHVNSTYTAEEVRAVLGLTGFSTRIERAGQAAEPPKPPTLETPKTPETPEIQPRTPTAEEVTPKFPTATETPPGKPNNPVTSTTIE